jgi:MFS family permease
MLTSGFFVGFGFFELPGGIFAAKFGPKKLVILGTSLNLIAVLASSFSPIFSVLVVLRFLAGLGYALAFPSIIVLIIRYFRTGSGGMATAMVAVSTSLGLAIGLFGWSVLGAVSGWRNSILVAGVLDLVVLLPILRLLPRDSLTPGFRIRLADLRQVVLNRQLAILGVAFLGAGASAALNGNFMVFYLEDHLRVDPALAGLIGGSGSILPMFAGIFVGRLYDRHRNWKMPVLVSSVILSVGVSLTAVDTLMAAIISNALVGLAAGALFTVGFAAARDLSSSPQFESFAIGWVDGFSLVGSFISPIYFSFLVLGYGYPSAWLIGGVAAVLFALPILEVRKK